MPNEIYIAVGNHRSVVGINEIIYSLLSCLSENFSVKLTRSLRPNGLNIVIDEFASRFDRVALEKTKELYPDTKIIIVATEFVTPISILGVELGNTFNFFGSLRDWRQLVGGTARSLLGGTQSYMRLRYLGFISALKYCDLLAAIHPQIMPAVSEMAKEAAPGLRVPLMVYPQIEISAFQQQRLADLPVGFTMTGTKTAIGGE